MRRTGRRRLRIRAGRAYFDLFSRLGLLAKLRRRCAEPNCVNGNIGELRASQNQAEFRFASAVILFAHHHDDAAPLRRFFLQKIFGAVHRVEKPRAVKPGLNVANRIQHAIGVCGHRPQQVHFVVITDHGGLAGARHHHLRENNSCLANFRKQRLNARACLQNENDGERITALIEVGDLLRDAIIKNLEIFLRKIKYRLAGAVGNGYRKGDQFHAKYKWLLLCGLLLLRMRARFHLNRSGRLPLAEYRQRNQRAQQNNRDETGLGAASHIPTLSDSEAQVDVARAGDDSKGGDEVSMNDRNRCNKRQTGKNLLCIQMEQN